LEDRIRGVFRVSEATQLLEPIGDALRRLAQPLHRHLNATGRHVVPERVVDKSLQGQR
jgi:hypothetical protein